MLKDKKAFTLIELIVTIAVLGMLVLLGGPRLLNYTQIAELTRIQHDTRVMENKMLEVLNQDNNYNEWDNNEKDLGTLVLKNQLYEKEGIASFVDRSYLRRNIASSENKVELAQNENEFGVGGDLHELSKESKGYKVIPEIYEKEINTRLNGTFYSNKNGKVYYEPNKPLPNIKNENLLACLAADVLDYEFSVINGKGTITGYNGTLTHLYIPSAFLVDDECVPVQVIGAGAFRNGTFTRVHIPESVKTIEENAFQGGQLIEVDIPHSVNSVGPNAFSNNPVKENGIIVNSSESSVSIDSSAFSGLVSESSPIYRTPTADKLKITVQTEVDSEGRRTGAITDYYGDSYRGSQSTGSSNVGSGSSGNFNNVISIPSVIIVNGETVEITEIAQGAYQGRGIIHVEFPETLELIEDYAFAGNQLIGVEIPRSVGHVGNYAFAFNEINGKLTMGHVEISEEGDYVNDINNLGNIAPNGVEVYQIDQARLLEHIFITSAANFEIPEEYNPGFTSPFDVIIENDGYITDKTELTFSHNYEDEVLEEQWELNGKILPNKPSGTFPSGNYTLKLKFMLNDGKWTNYDSISFTVNKYVEFMMNARGSTVLNDVEYGEGDSLLFNYTNSSNLNWKVPTDGLYNIDMMGASGGNGSTGNVPSHYSIGSNLPKGGNGARIEGSIALSKGDIVNLNIYSKANGGGKGRYTSNNKNHHQSGKDGGAGTIIKVNNETIAISGGGGGVGGRIPATYYGKKAGSGGAGGHGGHIGHNGKIGELGYDGINSPRGNYRAGGGAPSRGGEGSVYNMKGQDGPTRYDGGGGGGINGGYNGAGGGAGGSSLTNNKLINSIITDGYNSGDGKVIITYMGK